MYDAYEDRENTIWLATDGGAQQYDGYRWRSYTVDHGLGSSNQRTITQSADGAMWFADAEGYVSRMDGDTCQTWMVGEAGMEPSALVEAGDGSMWVGYWWYGEYMEIGANGLARSTARRGRSWMCRLCRGACASATCRQAATGASGWRPTTTACFPAIRQVGSGAWREGASWARW